MQLVLSGRLPLRSNSASVVGRNVLSLQIRATPAGWWLGRDGQCFVTANLTPSVLQGVKGSVFRRPGLKHVLRKPSSSFTKVIINGKLQLVLNRTSSYTPK